MAAPDLRRPVEAPSGHCPAVTGGVLAYSDGFVQNGPNTDEFLALCRELGAEPAITVQLQFATDAEIEAATINLLRFHEAETAILFCATRDNVRRLHATLQERGFGVVALSGEHSQSERNQALQALRDRRARVCVATDVASRGIDLPSVSLVIHVEIPRDAETLQHRSGRTGRAGKKGTAVLIVPYPRRKRVESMLRGAKIDAQWIDAPTPESIRAQDRERLLGALLEPVEFEDEDRKLADGDHHGEGDLAGGT